MPLLSLAEVASRTGMARSSIYRLIDEGKLSATQDPRGRKCVELTEVLRVFGAIKDGTAQERKPPDTSNKPVITSRHTDETGQDTLFSLMQELERTRAELQFKAKELDLKDRELALMQTRVEELKASNEQATTEKNHFLAIIERQSLLLAAPKPAAPARKRAPAKKAAPVPAPAKKTTPSTAPAKKSPAKKPAAPKVVAKKAAPAPEKKIRKAAATANKAKPAPIKSVQKTKSKSKR